LARTGEALRKLERDLLDHMLTKHSASVPSDLEFACQFSIKRWQKNSFRRPHSTVSKDVKYLAEYLAAAKKATDQLHVTLMETLKPSLSQFVSSYIRCSLKK
jgi:hypothetical protein